MPLTYDCTRPWRDQLDEDAIEAMIRSHAPEALDRLGLERLLTVKRMIGAYAVGDLSWDDLNTLTAHYDGLTIKRTPLGEDPEPAPAEGCVAWDLYTARMHHLIEGQRYDDLVKTAATGHYTVPQARKRASAQKARTASWRKTIRTATPQVIQPQQHSTMRSYKA